MGLGHSVGPLEDEGLRSVEGPSVQTHSEDSIGDGGPMLTSKILPHRRRPVPMAELGPGLRPEDEEGGIVLNHPNASKH